MLEGYELCQDRFLSSFGRVLVRSFARAERSPVQPPSWASASRVCITGASGPDRPGRARWRVDARYCGASPGATAHPPARVGGGDPHEGIEVPSGGQGATKRVHPVIDRLLDAGLPTKACCRVLGGGSPRLLPIPQPATVTDPDATAVAARIHPRGPRRFPWHLRLTASACRVDLGHASPRQRTAGDGAHEPGRKLGPARVRRLRVLAAADDLVNRKFHRLSPNELWVTDSVASLLPSRAPHA